MLAIVWAGVIFDMSTRTFGASFTDHLLREILAALHLRVSPHAFAFLATAVRKLGHFTEYAIFSIFLYYALAGGRRSAWNPRRALACILLAGLYSLTDEFHQRFVPGRGPSLMDCGFDTIGAALGMLVMYIAGRDPLQPDGERQGGASGDDKPIVT
ncbi:MAG TPA: VanZ family protein [Terriglobia bacterium]|nr:VanZ family protein [Terriglobia bacterium]